MNRVEAIERADRIAEASKKKLKILQEAVNLNSNEDNPEEGLEWWFAAINFMAGIIDGFRPIDSRISLLGNSIAGLQELKEILEKEKPPAKEPEAKQKETA